MTVQKLKPSEIQTNGGTQGRVSIEQELIDEYAGYLRAGVKLPAIIVYKDSDGVYWLVDGFHRLYAWLVVSPDKSIECDVRDGSLDEAVWFSCTDVNDKNGKRRTNEDKAKAVDTALAHDKAAKLSNRAIAEHCGVDEYMVRTRRQAASAGGPQIDNAIIVTRKGANGETQTYQQKRRPSKGKGKGKGKGKPSGDKPMTPVLEERSGIAPTDLASLKYIEDAVSLAAQIDRRFTLGYLEALVNALSKCIEVRKQKENAQ